MSTSHVTPILGHPQLDAIHYQVAAQTQAHSSLVLLGLLCCTSYLLQGITDVRLPTGGIEPTSLFGIAIAGSGEGKSAVANQLVTPISNFLEEHEQLALCQTNSSSSEGMIWSTKKDCLTRRLARLEALPEDYELDESQRTDMLEALRARLIDIESQSPQASSTGIKTFGQVTPASLRDSIRHERIRSAAIITAEGLELTSSGLHRQLSLLNSAWSGEPIMRALAKDGAEWLDFRLTIYLQLQPQPAREFFFNTHSQARDIGFAARALFCTPSSVSGKREFRRQNSEDLSAMRAYQGRVKEILQRNIDNFQSQSKQRHVLEFSQAAKRRWYEIAQQIEQESHGPDGRLREFPDHGPKLASNIARIAALIHAYEYDQEGEISDYTLEHAIKIARHFSEHFTEYFRTRTEREIDVPNVRDYLQRKRDEGIRFVPKKVITDSCPIPKVSRTQAALQALEAEGNILSFQVPRLTASGRKAAPTVLIDLRPDLPHDQQQMQEALAWS
ncbi:DUF3987 domain-containing protein [Halorhodospira halochloris]|uniref:DUF3987 domain-containing protein n=1 Tax=Halorhodospira halochloris TaxID=1052 RepID=UPI001EE8AB53|nr:DUF3987 domain-containing protein [Halorhodospira halochloris]MCG5547537.1 DUF3987 domain-containing protein [Halorhodospira halochloris]